MGNSTTKRIQPLATLSQFYNNRQSRNMADQAAAQDIAHELLAVVPALHNDNGDDVHPLMPAAANNEQQLHQEGPEPLTLPAKVFG